MRISIFIYFIISTTVLKAQVGNDLDSLISGEYELVGFNMGAKLTLDNGKIFHHKVSVWSCDGEGEIDEFGGIYLVEKNQLIFKPTIYIRSEYLEDKLTKSDTVNYVLSKHLFRDTLSILQWKNRIYLLGKEKLSLWGFPSKSDFFEFVNDINSGCNVDPNFSSYWQKKCNCGIDKELHTLIPQPWRDLLINKIIEAESINVEAYKSERLYEMIKSIITINKGALDGVKVGMKFYSDNNEDCACDMEIFEVNGEYSKGYAQICGPDDCIVGTQLSTYLKRENDVPK